MSIFQKEIRLNDAVCIELICNECANKFSTEIDHDFREQEFQHQSKDVIYCPYCEHQYDFTLKYDNYQLEVDFNGNDLFGGIKYSDKISIEEYGTSNPAKSKKFYYSQIDRLQKILDVKPDEHIVEQALNRLIYSGIITCLETYLSEVFTQIVFHSQYTLETFITEYEPYKKEKISLHTIFKRYNTLEYKVRDDLENFIFHNVSKLINIFNNYNFDLHNFEKIKKVANYIQKRHNLVHRSGVNEYDGLQEVNDKEIRDVIKDINSFVEYIDEKIDRKDYLPFDDDLPF